MWVKVAVSLNPQLALSPTQGATLFHGSSNAL
jgi:hypothetical protein